MKRRMASSLIMNQVQEHISLIIFLIIVILCYKASYIKNMIDQDYSKNVFLTRQDCFYRARYITNVNYKILLALLKGDQYLGSAQIEFDLHEITH